MADRTDEPQKANVFFICFTKSVNYLYFRSEIKFKNNLKKNFLGGVEDFPSSYINLLKYICSVL